MAAAPNKTLPRDGQVIVSMMKDMGIQSYEPRVVHQLMEFAIRYVSCVLDDARAFANHSKKKSIDNEDVKLAVMMQLEKIFTSPPPRDLLLEVARSKNNMPLPLVKPHCGIRLPPDRYCFSSCNYRLKYNKKGENKSKFGLGGAGSIGGTLKVTKAAGGISVVKRPSTVSNVARTQAISAVAKPVVKLSSGSVVVNSPGSGAKARIQVTPGQGTPIELQAEAMDSSNSNNGSKRKREDE